jgi:hypothetical protein
MIKDWNVRVEEKEKEANEVLQHNILAHKNNLVIYHGLESLFKSLGIDKKRWGYANTRSKKAEWLPNLFLSALISTITITDPHREYSSFTSKIARMRWELTEAQKEAERKENIQKIEDERKSKYNATILEMAKYAVKYNCDNDYQSIVDAILNKDKYLRLAYYLRKNREDWTDGYSYAEQGINGFTVVTEQDKEIDSAINDAITNWDGDGRIFRDMEWSYDAIEELASPEVIKDLEIVESFEAIVRK